MHEIINCSLWKNVINVIWCVWSPYAQTRIKFHASFTRDMMSHFLKNWFKIILNLYEVWKSRNLTRLHIDTCVGYGKKFNRFRVSCDVRCPKPRHTYLWSRSSKLFSHITQTCNLCFFVQPPSAGSNHPANASPGDQDLW